MLKREMIYQKHIIRYDYELQTGDSGFEMRVLRELNKIPTGNIISINYLSQDYVLVTYKQESTVSLISAVSRNWVIGKNGSIPWKSKEDMSIFKEITTDNVVIMGRKTFESMGSKPLPNRVNIVLTKGGIILDGITVENDLLTAINNARLKYPGKEIIIIEGASLYKEALDKDLVHRIYLNKMDIIIEDGDTFFPELTNLGYCDLISYKPTCVIYKEYNIKICYPDGEKIGFTMRYYNRQ